MTAAKCSACPIPGPCFGERAAWACKWSGPDAKDSERESLRVLSGIEPSPPVQPPIPAPIASPSPVLTPLSEALRARKLGGRNCPHGSPASCGCSGLAACSLLGRDVRLDDCAACLATGPRSQEVHR